MLSNSFFQSLGRSTYVHAITLAQVFAHNITFITWIFENLKFSMRRTFCLLISEVISCVYGDDDDDF